MTRYLTRPAPWLATLLLTTSGLALAADNELIAIPNTTIPSIDGTMDEAWQAASPLMITLDELPYKPENGYHGMEKTELEIRSMYDDTNIYFLVRWKDPTLSTKRFPWEKQADGSWKQLSNKDQTGHENTYYEDKMSLFWNISQKGFAKKGCDMSCHMPENGLLDGIKDSSAGRHYTRDASETVDMWHWKSARTNPNGQMDDQYVNSARSENKEWGRQSDDKTGGGYYNNLDEATGKPAWMNAEPQGEATNWVFEKMKTEFVDDFKSGDQIGGHVTGPFSGSRGDITAKGQWQDGVWTVEITRALVTTGENNHTQDIQFSDLNKAYHFGAAVFDNSQINHMYHTKSFKLTFAH